MNRFTHLLWQRAIAGGVGVALLGTGLIAPAQEAVPVALPTVPAAQLQQWLADLDSDSFEVREAAAEKLSQAGPAAVDVLSGGIVSESAEVAWRSGASLERIALGGDEKTLARITSILDGLSTKGRPGLKTMAAEMHVRQKHFRHDRAVASLKQNGAVFASDDMGLGGPAFFGGPVAIGAPVMIEAIADEVIEVAEPIPAEPVPVKPEGIFGLIGRVLEGAIKVAEEPPVPRVEIRKAAPPIIPDLPPTPEPPAVLPVEEKIAEPAREETPAIEEKPAEEKPEEPAKILEEFKELAKPAKEAEPAKEAAPAAIQALAPPPLLEEPVEIVEGGAAIPIAADFGVIGMIDTDLDEVETVATLVLGKQWRGGDEGLKVLKDVPEIYSLSVSGAKISDVSLPYMAELPNLSNLMIHDAGVTRQGLRKLREQKPDLQIQARGEAMMGVNADVGTSPLVLTSIFPDSGAFQAGIREGDVVLSVDGNPIKDFADLTISIYGCKAGEKVRVEYERSGAKKTTVVTLKKRPDGQ